MKKILGVILVFGLVFIPALTVMAASKPMSDTVKNQLAAQAKNTLESRQWEVYVSSTGKKAILETDVFTFAEGKVISQNLSIQGYKKSNLNVGIQEDGSVVWETMQVNANNDLAFLRGELSGGGMKGVISLQPVKGAKTVMNFSTVMPKTTTVEAQPQKKGGK